MSEPERDKKRGSHRRDLTGFFVAGGPVQPGRGCYVRRAADEEFARLVRAGEYVQVFAPRHMGKSSLMARLAEELRSEGHQVAVVDLTQVGARERNDDLGRWFYSFAFRLIRQLRLKVDLQEWWQENAVLTNRQRLTELYWDLILENTSGPVTIFIDELQCLDNFAGVEQLLASIRAAHNARAAEPTLARLNFVMLGINVPAGFDADSEYSPFAVAQPVALHDFRLHQLDAFGPALGLARPQANEALERIHFWTGGQPYLTQKLARALARARMRDTDLADPSFIVDALAYRLYLNPSSLRNEPHLSYLQHALIGTDNDHDEILAVYGRVRKGGRVIVDPESAAQRRLVSQGLLVPTRAGTLAVRNRIYHQVFTARWANEQLPFRWRRIGLVAALVALAVVVPIWYTQFLPRPWTRVLTAPTSTLAEVRHAWQTLSRLPGHGASADRMLLDRLARMSRKATDVSSVEAADELLRTLPGAQPLADQLVAEFWDRQASSAELRHQRDAALMARLRSLISPTLERRRLAGALIGEDYGLLAATLRVPDGFDQAVLGRDGRGLLAVRGNTIYRWRTDQLPPRSEATWEATALTFRPVVSRRAIQAKGRAGADLALEVDLDHDRPFDLSITLTAPSGRNVTVQPGLGPASIRRHRFSAGEGGALAPLAEEPRGGTWTLSVADRVEGVTGELAAWTLDFGDLRLPEPPGSPPLALEDPQPEPLSRLFLGPAGRYAIAIPPAGDAAARVWDLASRRPVSMLPVNQDDRIIGFVLDQRVVMVHGAGGIRAWTLSTGDPVALPGVGRQATLSALSPDGDVLALVGMEEERAVEVYDLIERRLLGTTAPGVDHTAIAVAPGARFVAVADPDRAVRIWRLGEEQPYAELDAAGTPSGLRFSPRADRLAISLADGGLILWRPGGDGVENVRRYAGPGPWQASFDRSGARLLTGTGAGGFRLIGRDFGNLDLPLLRAGFGQGRPVWSDLDGDESLAVTGSPAEGVLRLWRLPASRVGRTSRIEADARADAVALSPDGTLMAAGMSDGTLRLLPAATRPPLAEEAGPRVNFFAHPRAVCCVAFSGDGRVLASAARDGSLRVWDVEPHAPRDFIAFQPTGHAVRRLAVSDSGERVLVVAGPHVRIWDAKDGRLLFEQQPGQRITAVTSLPDGAGFLLGDATGSVWRLATEPDRLERLFEAAAGITALAVPSSGRPLAIATADGALRLIDPDDRQLKGAAEPLPRAADALAFSADRDHLLVRSGHWLHRYRLIVYQLLPESSRLLPAETMRGGIGTADKDGRRLHLLAGTGMPMPLTVALDAGDAEPLQGDAGALLEVWQERVRAGAVSDPAPAASAPASPGPGQ